MVLLSVGIGGVVSGPTVDEDEVAPRTSSSSLLMSVKASAQFTSNPAPNKLK